jgi:hypothetical protein
MLKRKQITVRAGNLGHSVDFSAFSAQSRQISQFCLFLMFNLDSDDPFSGFSCHFKNNQRIFLSLSFGRLAFKSNVYTVHFYGQNNFLVKKLWFWSIVEFAMCLKFLFVLY